jgi:aspartyl-tRNA(Asn)/glutamyl-tRNA(Gln) amidotransferase subunit A
MIPLYTLMTPSPRRSNHGIESAVVEAGIAGLSAAYRDGAFDPVKVVAAYMARIAAYDDRVGAFVDLDRDRACGDAAASAARWSRGQPLSTLDGVPLAVKSNIAVAGLPWTGGIGAYRERLAPRDAACVARLRRAGAIILGTVNMDEAALGAMTDNPWFGRTRNPHRLDRIAGGSSGGAAAAVAAGFCAAALGTDTFGSVRIPAGYCGVFGHKPVAGLLSKNRVIPLKATFDTVGFLARSATDCRILTDFFSLQPAPWRPPAAVGLWGFRGDLAPLGKRVQRRMIELGIDFSALDLTTDLFAHAMKPALLLAESEAARTYREVLDNPESELSPRLRAMLEWGRGQGRAKRLRAKEDIAASTAALLREIAPLQTVLMPTTPTVAPAWQEAEDRFAARFTLAASLCGLPAVALPFGCDRQGMPYSVQVIGHCDRTMLDLAGRLAIRPPRPRFL